MRLIFVDTEYSSNTIAKLTNSEFDDDSQIGYIVYDDRTVIVSRVHDYFYNVDTINDLLESEKNNPDKGELTVITNDEQLLRMAQYDEDKNEFKVDFMFELYRPLVSLKSHYPNVRRENDLTKLYQNKTIGRRALC